MGTLARCSVSSTRKKQPCDLSLVVFKFVSWRRGLATEGGGHLKGLIWGLPGSTYALRTCLFCNRHSQDAPWLSPVKRMSIAGKKQSMQKLAFHGNITKLPNQWTDSLKVASQVHIVNSLHYQKTTMIKSPLSSAVLSRRLVLRSQFCNCSNEYLERGSSRLRNPLRKLIKILGLGNNIYCYIMHWDWHAIFTVQGHPWPVRHLCHCTESSLAQLTFVRLSFLALQQYVNWRQG